ncbi:MAG: energy transducer TonB [Sulfurospirillum sp.]|nr:energy transducer TonB [Campylobacteraceae bacterium]MBP9566699.1 energy transducer TonB [Sulfurospirillum sp.]
MPQPIEINLVKEFIISSVESLPTIVDAPTQKPIKELIDEKPVIVPQKEEIKVQKSITPKKVVTKPLPPKESMPLLEHVTLTQTTTATSPYMPSNTVEKKEEVSQLVPSHQPSADSEEIQHYLTQVKQKIQRHLEYPTQAKKMRLEGETILKFSIFSNGSLSENSIEIVQSSGKKIFDEQAIVALKEAAPYPSPPKESMVLSVPVSFKLKS